MAGLSRRIAVVRRPHGAALVALETRLRDRRRRSTRRLHLLRRVAEPGREELVLVRGRVCLRHPQPLSLQQRPSDGGAEPPRRLARADRRRRAGRADAAHAPRRDGADRGVHAAGHQRRHQPRTAGRRRRRSTTCTSTWCRAGTATPTSCPSSANTRVLPEDLATTAKRLQPIFERLADRIDCASDRLERRTIDRSAVSALASMRLMILELTPNSRPSSSQSSSSRARSSRRARPRIDESGEFPARRHAGGGRARAARRRRSRRRGAGWAATTSATRSRSRPSRAPARPWRSSLSVTNSLVAELIAHAGRAPQKEQWLRRLASGDAIGAFALSEPDAGTDAANQQTKAVQTRRRLPHHRRKVWVANADAAAVAIVFASHAAGPARPGRHGVPRADGRRRASRARRAPIRSASAASAAWISSSTSTVGDEQVLGRVDQGFRLAMWALQGGRVAIAAQALGIGEAALDEAIALRESARAVRPADRELPGDSVDARRHGDRARRRAAC